MAQLLKVTSTRFQAIHFTEKARLVPTNNIDVERRKAMARHFAFRTRYTGRPTPDMNSVNQINLTFHPGSAPKTVSPSSGASGSPQPTADTYTPQSVQNLSLQSQSAFYSVPAGAAAPVDTDATAAAVYQPVPVLQGQSQAESHIQESQAAYNVQRGSFEMRVASGDLAYVPALEMTIITSYPGVQFEYVGGFNYVPPSSDPANNMNITI